MTDKPSPHSHPDAPYGEGGASQAEAKSFTARVSVQRSGRLTLAER